MSAKAANHWASVKDPELAAWLMANGSDARELIVEVRLPERTVAVEKRSDGRKFPVGVKSSAPDQRAAILAEFHAFLASLLDVPPVVLKAAGAVAVKATSKQVQQFVDHPLVKAIRPNRQLAKAV